MQKPQLGKPQYLVLSSWGLEPQGADQLAIDKVSGQKCRCSNRKSNSSQSDVCPFKRNSHELQCSSTDKPTWIYPGITAGSERSSRLYKVDGNHLKSHSAGTEPDRGATSMLSSRNSVNTKSDEAFDS